VNAPSKFYRLSLLVPAYLFSFTTGTRDEQIQPVLQLDGSSVASRQLLKSRSAAVYHKQPGLDWVYVAVAGSGEGALPFVWEDGSSKCEKLCAKIGGSIDCNIKKTFSPRGSAKMPVLHELGP